MWGETARNASACRHPAVSHRFTKAAALPPGTAGPAAAQRSIKLPLKNKMQWTNKTECKVCLNIAVAAHPKREADICPVVGSQQTLPAFGP